MSPLRDQPQFQQLSFSLSDACLPKLLIFGFISTHCMSLTGQLLRLSSGQRIPMRAAGASGRSINCFGMSSVRPSSGLRWLRGSVARNAVSLSGGFAAADSKLLH